MCDPDVNKWIDWVSLAALIWQSKQEDKKGRNIFSGLLCDNIMQLLKSYKTKVLQLVQS